MPALQEWNLQSLTAVQAMLGLPSPNLRRVTLDHNGQLWLISFVLAHEDAEDREEIEDFGTEWDALQSSFEQLEIRILITSEPLPWPAPPARVIYQRREAVSK